MIIIKLRGGLGNQLFQYALGKNLSLSNNAELKFDISDYKNNPDRHYCLNFFNIKTSLAGSTEIDNLKKSSIKKLMEKLKPYKYKSTITEKFGCFNPNILKLKNNKYLIGYWQSEKYFKNIEKIIRQEITLKDKPSNYFSELSSQINYANSVSLHVRRGDYVKNKKFSKIFNALDLNYYKKAVDLITQQINYPYFFIFSDDLSWAKDNLSLPCHHALVNADKKFNDCEELILMSLCKHNIIANSSFSWWGAWLNKNPNKIVIAPKKWFNDNSKDTSDLLPDNWIKI